MNALFKLEISYCAHSDKFMFSLFKFEVSSCVILLNSFDIFFLSVNKVSVKINNTNFFRKLTKPRLRFSGLLQKN